MKTRTYARLALLIPLLIWLVFLLLALLINILVPVDRRPDGPSSLFGILEMIIYYYVFGILVWFLPYLVLSIGLLIMSFKSWMKMLRSAFFLSPFAMAILVMLEATIFSLSTVGDAVSSSDYMTTFKNTTEINLAVGLLALVCGYICVGIGYGIYRLLQRSGRIMEEEQSNPEIQNKTSQESA